MGSRVAAAGILVAVVTHRIAVTVSHPNTAAFSHTHRDAAAPADRLTVANRAAHAHPLAPGLVFAEPSETQGAIRNRRWAWGRYAACPCSCWSRAGAARRAWPQPAGPARQHRPLAPGH